MNFSSHIANRREALRSCLKLTKLEMLTELHACLISSKLLLKTSKFDFYLSQFECVKIGEFATTDYGITAAKNFLNNPHIESENSRGCLESEILYVCENVLTYTVDDCCSMQSEFHWFYCIEGNFAYKQSELGEIHVPRRAISSNIRVAKMSEIPDLASKYFD